MEMAIAISQHDYISVARGATQLSLDQKEGDSGGR